MPVVARDRARCFINIWTDNPLAKFDSSSRYQNK